MPERKLSDKKIQKFVCFTSVAPLEKKIVDVDFVIDENTIIRLVACYLQSNVQSQQVSSNEADNLPPPPAFLLQPDNDTNAGDAATRSEKNITFRGFRINLPRMDEGTHRDCVQFVCPIICPIKSHIFKNNLEIL